MDALDERLLNEMFQAYRPDLEVAAAAWRRARAAVSSPADPLAAAGELAQAEQVLDRAHPFLPEASVERLKERIAALWGRAAPPDGDATGVAELSRIVGEVLAEAEATQRSHDHHVRRHLVPAP